MILEYLILIVILCIFIYINKKCRNNYIIISIEGNIGSGKTTLIDILKKNIILIKIIFSY